MKTHDLTMLITLAVLAAAPAVVRADDVHCPPDLGDVTVDGNVLVAAPCRLTRTTVKGSVLLYAGGSLIAREARIEGNVQADDADFVDITDTFVNGSIQLDDMVGDDSIVERTTVGGSIQLKGNRPRLEVLDNIVSADVQAFSNTGGVVIAGNTIDGNLQCKENDPPPAGGDNEVQGNKEDQCANLLSEAAVSGSAQNNVAASSADVQQGGGGSIDPLASLLLLLGSLIVRLRPSRSSY